MPRLLLKLLQTLRRRRCSPGRIASKIAPRTLLGLGVTKHCVNDIYKRTLKMFIHGFKGFSQDEEVETSTRLWLRWEST